MNIEHVQSLPNVTFKHYLIKTPFDQRVTPKEGVGNGKDK
jgi:hypothetical protein